MLQNVGRYRILSPLGKGAMGVVYLAADPVLNRQVALKTIDLDIDDPARLEFLRGRLLRDARAAASLTHANIVSVFDVVEDGEIAAIIMEFVDGENLSTYLARNPSPDAAFTVRIVRAMAAALDYTHSRGVIHRDIKPANVMLDVSLTPKITDFGIARITEGVTTTMTGVVMGTIEYMAPEQVKGEKADGRADQFALGVVAYRMLTGHTLFGDHSMATIAYKIVNEAPASICSQNAGLPAAMNAVFDKVFAKDPNSRYPSCGEFAAALGGAFSALDREGPTAAMLQQSRQQAPPKAPPPPPKRSKLAAPALAAIVAACAAAGVVIWRPWAPVPAAPAVSQSLPPVTPAAVPPPPTTVETLPAKSAAKEPAEKVARPPADPPAKTPAKAEKVSAPPEPDTDAVDPGAPLPAVAAFNHGRDLMKSQDYNGAIQAFSKATDLRPNWAQAYHSRGNAYYWLRQYDAAIRDYSHAILLNPAMASFYISRAESYVKMQHDDPALSDLNQAISIKGDAPIALGLRGDIYLRREDFRKALADFNQVISLQPMNISAYRQRAVARRALGDRPGARADMGKANELAAKKGGG